MAEQYEKKLEKDKYKNVSKEMQVELKMKEQQMKRVQELEKQQKGPFNLVVINSLFIFSINSQKSTIFLSSKQNRRS